MVLGAVPGGRGLGTVHLLLAMAAALVTAAAIVAFALAFLNEEAVEQSPQSSQTLVVKAADIEEQPGVPTLSAVHPLEAYFNDTGKAVELHTEWVTWEWEGGGTHRGALFGPRVAVVYQSGGSRVWPDSPSYIRRLARRFAEEGRELASIEAPRVLRSDHENLVRAVRTEARRWRRFDAVVRKSGRAEWSAFRKWERWSNPAFRIQSRYLEDWASEVRRQSRKRDVALPLTLAPFVVRVERLVR